VTVGQFGTYAPIGVEAITTNGVVTGYEIAWKDSGSGQYIVWAPDSGGNYTNNVLSGVSGTSTALESIETSFHQDLNGDGTIGLPAYTSSNTVIEFVWIDQARSSRDQLFLRPRQRRFRSSVEIWRRGAVTVGQFGPTRRLAQKPL